MNWQEILLDQKGNRIGRDLFLCKTETSTIVSILCTIAKKNLLMSCADLNTDCKRNIFELDKAATICNDYSKYLFLFFLFCFCLASRP